MTSEEEIYKEYEFSHKYDIIQGLEEFSENKTVELFKSILVFLMEKLNNTDGGMIDIPNSCSTVEIKNRVDEDSAPAYFKIKKIYYVPDDDKNVYAQLTCNGKPADPSFCLNEWLDKEEDTDYVLKNMIKLIKIIEHRKEK